jgi:hypothetical protein
MEDFKGFSMRRIWEMRFRIVDKGRADGYDELFKDPHQDHPRLEINLTPSMAHEGAAG